MQVYDTLGAGPQGGGTAVALGYFDGVHLGHQQVLAAARRHAAEAGLAFGVFTFTLPVGHTRRARRLMSGTQKREALEALGVEALFQPPFEGFCNLAPDVFFHDVLLATCRARALFCGRNFTFGKGRAGGADTLAALCEAAGIPLFVQPTMQYAGAPVSSSRIREALAAGEVPLANAMLTRPFEIDFAVRHGQGLGRTLGIPTLNQAFPPDRQPPAEGVYITQAVLEGREWPAATGFGPRPTVGGKEVTCETFVPHYSGDAYGERVRVRFFERIGDIEKFAGETELAAAVQGWAAQAERYFAAGV